MTSVGIVNGIIAIITFVSTCLQFYVKRSIGKHGADTLRGQVATPEFAAAFLAIILGLLNALFTNWYVEVAIGIILLAMLVASIYAWRDHLSQLWLFFRTL